jgi:glycosyltransferase involved in cell wall biosynthesis
MKVLQLCHKMPYPLHDGGAFSIYNTALGLISQKAELKLLAINTPKNLVDVNCVPAGFREMTRFESSRVDTRFNPLRAFLNLFSNQSYFVERFFSKQFNTDLIRILTGEEFDIIQLEHIYMCLYLDTIRKYSKAKVMLRPQNVENKVWKRFLARPANPVKKYYLLIAANRLRKFEMEMAEKVDGIIAISGDDAGTFHAYAPETPLVTVPIGFDFSSIPACNTQKQYDNSPVFYHLGSMDWLPNVQGMKWFIQEVIPQIIIEYPGFLFHIAGKRMPDWFFKRQGRNLVVDREVKESFIYQQDKSVMIVPLLSGGGLRAKIIEGMALGKTIISTSIGAEGIPYTDQENILIADTKEDFAIQVMKCRNSANFCRKIGENARKLALENYDCRITGKSMMQFYDQQPG